MHILITWSQPNWTLKCSCSIYHLNWTLNLFCSISHILTRFPQVVSGNPYQMNHFCLFCLSTTRVTTFVVTIASDIIWSVNYYVGIARTHNICMIIQKISQNCELLQVFSRIKMFWPFGDSWFSLLRRFFPYCHNGFHPKQQHATQSIAPAQSFSQLWSLTKYYSHSLN